jgi:hypothetical protein
VASRLRVSWCSFVLPERRVFVSSCRRFAAEGGRAEGAVDMRLSPASAQM